MTVDVFKETLIIISKQRLMDQQLLGITVMSSLGALFTKDGAKKVQDAVQSQIEDLDDRLLGDIFEEEAVMVNKHTPRQNRQPREQKKFMQTLERFHMNMVKMSGGRIPSLNAVIKKAAKEQQKYLELPPDVRESLHGNDPTIRAKQAKGTKK